MEKSKLIKVFLVTLVSLMLVFASTTTFAADSTTNFIDVTNSSASNTNSNNTSSNTNTNSNTNSNSNSTNSNTNTNNTIATSNTNANNVNSSKYNNNTNLPKTGIAETGSIVCVVFALAVSAVYAFKKLRDYNV